MVKNPAPNKAPISKDNPPVYPPAEKAAITSVDPFANERKVTPANDSLMFILFDIVVNAGVK